ncbi:glycoside hydrolase family 76 protein [Daejeonia sp. YH14]|uniref:glycoside hydrolase family 76 protein n=1 Tax=Daejeonia sp. YH14 TaxID=3439042 RepID=UPI003F4928F3
MKIINYIKCTLLAGIGVVTLVSCEDDAVPLRDPSTSSSQDIKYTYAATADSMQTATYNTYLGGNNTFIQDNAGNTTFNYWPNAHALDVLVDGYIRTGDQSYVAKMKALHDGIKIKNGGDFNNVFNDDMIWLGNACMRAYAATNDTDYKNTAIYLWGIIKQSWTDDVFGGGITWKQDTPYSKNAVSNAPAAILAMRLYDADHHPDDLEWAKKIYQWQKNNLVDPANGEVWDNISIQDGQTITNKDWVFTYNMGTWIGAGLRLYHATEDVSYLQDAVRSGKTLMTSSKLTSEGLLKNEGQGDGGLFKGICVRYFTELIEEANVDSSTHNDFVNFLQYNARTFYRYGITRPAMTSGSDWKVAPTGTTDLTTQLSGMMLMEAAAKLKAESILE